jgi:hypothetical protein
MECWNLVRLYTPLAFAGPLGLFCTTLLISFVAVGAKEWNLRLDLLILAAVLIDVLCTRKVRSSG